MADDLASLLGQLPGKIGNQPEPIGQVQALVQRLQGADESPLTDEEMQVFKRNIPNIVQNVVNLRNKSPSEEYRNHLAELLGLLLQMIPTITDHPKALDIVSGITDWNKEFYKYFDQDNKAFPSSFIKGQPDDPFAEWRQGLKENDIIDALKVDEQYKNLAGWSQAKIIQILDNDLVIQFAQESSDYDKIIPRNSLDIAPEATFTKDTQWRQAIEEGSNIDVYGEGNIWYNATVLGTKTVQNDNGTEAVYLTIGFRVYEEEGQNSDEKGTFRGLGEQSDEIINMMSVRIAPFNTFALPWTLPKEKYKEECIVDSNDLNVLYPELTYFVTRPGYSRNKNFVKNLNQAAQAGLFQDILTQLENSQKLPFSKASVLIYLVMSVFPFYHRRFAQEYIPRLEKAVADYFLNAQDAVIREFKKNTIENLMSWLQAILKRIYTISDTELRVENLILQISLKCLQSNFLDQRISGLKGILDAITITKRTNRKQFGNQNLPQWILEHNIINTIFGSSGHYQLISRSAEIIKILALYRLLTKEHLQLILQVTERNDVEAKLHAYKVLGEAGVMLDADLIELIVQRIQGIPAESLIKEEINLISDITRYPLRVSDLAERIKDFLWQVYIQNPAYSPECKAIALEALCNLLKSYKLRDQRLNVLSNCLEPISRNQSAYQALCLIQKLLGTFMSNPSKLDEHTKETACQVLITDYDFFQVFFKNLEEYLQQIRKATANLKGEAVMSFDTGAGVTHRQQLEERFSLLTLILQSSDQITLSKVYMDLLWTLFNDSPVEEERSMFLQNLSDLVETKEITVLNAQDTALFYQEKYMSPDAKFSNLTEAGLKLFKGLFLMMNANHGNLYKDIKLARQMSYGRPIGGYQGQNTTSFGSSNFGSYGSYGMTSYGGSGYYKSNTLINQEEPELLYTVNAQPIQLEGFQALREIIYQASPEIANQAIQFHHQFYQNISEQVKAELVQIRQELINYCLQKLRQKNSIQDQQRSILLLKTFIEECQKKGTGSLKSHSAMLKGEMHNLTVMNNYSYYPYNYKIPKKITLDVQSNTTVYELKCLICTQAQLLPNQFRLIRFSPHGEIKDSDNGKTLKELSIRHSESFSISKRTLNIPQATLIENGELTPKFQAVLMRWFQAFADVEGKISPDACAAFTNSCTGERLRANDRKIKEVFRMHDKNKDGYLSFEDFTDFYLYACTHKLSVVWSNLYAYNYRNDLKNWLDLEEEKQTDPLSDPSYLLSQEDSNFQLIFEVADNQQLATEAWELIVKLPTNPTLRADVLNLQQSWSNLFSGTSLPRLLYTLQIIEAIMEDPSLLSEAEKEASRQWKRAFLGRAGYPELFKSVLQLEAKSWFGKKCLVSLLHLLGTFLLAAFSVKNPEIYNIMTLVREQTIMFLLRMKTDKTLLKTAQPKGFKQEQKAVKQSIIPLKTENEKNYTQSAGFKELTKEIINEELAESILQETDFSTLISKLVEMVGATLSQDKCYEEDYKIIDFALELMVGCLLQRNELITLVYNPQGLNIEQFLINGLTYPKALLVRKSFASAFGKICEKVQYEDKPPVPFFLDVLIRHMPAGKAQNAEYGEFFELLCTLVDHDVSAPTINYSEFVENIMLQIFEHPFTETRTSLESDKVLLGLLRLCNRIFENSADLKAKALANNFIPRAFTELLFPPTKDLQQIVYSAEIVEQIGVGTPPKCKVKSTRQQGYKLLISLTNDHPDTLKQLISSLTSLQSQIKIADSWIYSPGGDLRSAEGYAGMTNLGCVCYMISMLQQFFMIPQFRYHILAIDDGKEPTNIEWQKGEVVDTSDKAKLVDDNLLHQLQRLFTYLELTDRQSVDPSDFCFAYKDLDGQPVNVGVQQDAQEFLSMFLARIETLIKGTPYQSLVSDVFGGKFVIRMTCQSCQNVRESEEDFVNISLEIQHCNTIYDCLQNYIQGEIISDYQCENCNNKCDLQKRILISDLPNILIVHLKRIVFNFDTFTNQKINSRLEFPTTLNMEPYTKDSVLRQDENLNPLEDAFDYEYELAGVVIHTGTADSGHYYSFIRNRNKDGTLNPDKWSEFNDYLVRNFDPENLEEECFGTGGDQDASVDWMKNQKTSISNAYMLVYQKCSPGTVRHHEFGEEKEVVATEEREFGKFEPFIPASNLRDVLGDNEFFMFERNLYSGEFFNFFTKTVENAVNQNVDITIPAANFAINVVAHAENNQNLPSLCKAVLKSFEKFPQSCKEFFEKQLENKLQTFASVMFTCSEKSTRRHLMRLFRTGLIQIADNDFSQGSLAWNIMQGLFDMIPEYCTKHWSRFESYWELLYRFYAHNEAFLSHLVQMDAVFILADFYLETKSPFADSSRKDLGTKNWNPDFNGLIKLLGLLLEKAADGNFEISPNGLKCLEVDYFYEKALILGYDGLAIGKIIRFYSLNSYEKSLFTTSIIVKFISEYEINDLSNTLLLIVYLLQINDDYSVHRLEWLMGIPNIRRQNSLETDLPQFGSKQIKYIDDPVYQFKSSLCFDHTASSKIEPVMQLIWSIRGRLDDIGLSCVKYICELALSNEPFKEFLQVMPGLTYQYVQYMDWAQELLDDYQRTYVKKPVGGSFVSKYALAMSGRQDEADKHALFNAVKELHANFKEAVPYKGPGYVVGATLNELTVGEEERNGVRVSVVEVYTQYAISIPSKSGNEALPNKQTKAASMRAGFGGGYGGGVGGYGGAIGGSYGGAIGGGYGGAISGGYGGAIGGGYGGAIGSGYGGAIGGNYGGQSGGYYGNSYGASYGGVSGAGQRKGGLAFNIGVGDYGDSQIEEDLPLQGGVIVRYEAWNRSSEPVRLNLIMGPPELTPNYYRPKAPVTVEIAPNAVRDILIIQKLNPEEDWGDLSFDFTLEEAKTFTEADLQPVQTVQQNTEIPSQGFDNYDDFDDFDEFADDVPPGMMECPYCTLHNPTTAVVCSICGAFF